MNTTHQTVISVQVAAKRNFEAFTHSFKSSMQLPGYTDRERELIVLRALHVNEAYQMLASHLDPYLSIQLRDYKRQIIEISEQYQTADVRRFPALSVVA